MIFVARGASWLAIILSTILYSRYIFLFSDPIATLGISVIALSFVCMLFFRIIIAELYIVVCYMFVFTLLCVWLASFSLSSGLAGEWRMIGNYNGIFVVIPMLMLMRHFGLDSFWAGLHKICATYVLVYVVFSSGLVFFDWFSSIEPQNILLRDPSRGTRMFACHALIWFVIFAEAAKIRNNYSLKSISLLILCCYAEYMAMSRMAMFAGIIILLASILTSKRVLALIFRTFAWGYGPLAIISILSVSYISLILEWVDPISLSLRIENLQMAYRLFGINPFLGIGIPSDDQFYQIVLGQLYFPEDLGAVGVAATFGLLGLILFTFMLVAVAGGVSTAFRDGTSHSKAMGYTGCFVLFLSYFWPTIIYGDGSIIASALIARQMLYKGKSFASIAESKLESNKRVILPQINGLQK
jgi:hypothetical protein